MSQYTSKPMPPIESDAHKRRIIARQVISEKYHELYPVIQWRRREVVIDKLKPETKDETK